MADNPLEGFKILQYKYKVESEAVRQIFFKIHDVRALEPSKPSDRTLFCANIPPWMDSGTLKFFFQPHGKIENIFMEFEPSVGEPTKPSDKFFPAAKDPYRTGNGYKFAYVVFERSSSVRACMNTLGGDKIHIASTANNPVITGVKKYIRNYNSQIPDRKELLASVQQYMTEYDAAAANKTKQDEELGEADADGWITVTNTTKKKPAKVSKNADEQNKRGKKGRRKKKKVGELKNFYAHQIKDDKINHIRELRAKFEEDKIKIAKMKNDRKFRPF